MVVVDASALVEMAHRTDLGLAFRSLLTQSERVAAPELLRAEIVSVFRKDLARGALSAKQAREALEQTLSLIDEFYPLEPLQQEALSEGSRLQHSTHDMFYFVLARRMAATLMTADRRLMELCTCNGIDCIEEAKVELNEERRFGQFAQREPQCDPRHSSQR